MFIKSDFYVEQSDAETSEDEDKEGDEAEEENQNLIDAQLQLAYLEEKDEGAQYGMDEVNEDEIDEDDAESEDEDEIEDKEKRRLEEVINLNIHVLF